MKNTGLPMRKAVIVQPGTEYPAVFKRPDAADASTEALWDILRTTNCHTELSCNQIAWAKEELLRRGHRIV